MSGGPGDAVGAAVSIGLMGKAGDAPSAAEAPRRREFFSGPGFPPVSRFEAMLQASRHHRNKT
jgi:hypothetical protein